MPCYEFFARDGSRIERVFSMRNVPQSVKHNGKRYTLAAFSLENVTAVMPQQRGETDNAFPHVEYSLPKGDVGGGTTPEGRPIIKSKHHRNELVRQSEGRMHVE